MKKILLNKNLLLPLTSGVEIFLRCTIFEFGFFCLQELPYIWHKQELNVTPKPTKNKTKEALKATQAKEEKEAKKAKEAEEANKAKKAKTAKKAKR